jgi:hypothetical protein
VFYLQASWGFTGTKNLFTINKGLTETSAGSAGVNATDSHYYFREASSNGLHPMVILYFRPDIGILVRHDTDDE